MAGDFEDVAIMAREIVKVLDSEYFDYLDEECIDILQMKNICSLYLTHEKKKKKSNKIKIEEVELTSPRFDKPKKNAKKILDSEEFRKKYRFFIKIIFLCIKIGVELFDKEKTKKGDEFMIIKNNYQLMKSIVKKKQELIDEHILDLRNQRKNAHMQLDENYKDYANNFIIKTQLLDTILRYIDRITTEGIMDRSDNMFSLIIPYFHKPEEFIEEYGN